MHNLHRSDMWTRRRAMEVVFKDIEASIGDRKILQGVSGQCRPGELLAIMGASGGSIQLSFDFLKLIIYFIFYI